MTELKWILTVCYYNAQVVVLNDINFQLYIQDHRSRRYISLKVYLDLVRTNITGNRESFSRALAHVHTSKRTRQLPTLVVYPRGSTTPVIHSTTET